MYGWQLGILSIWVVFEPKRLTYKGKLDLLSKLRITGCITKIGSLNCTNINQMLAWLPIHNFWVYLFKVDPYCDCGIREYRTPHKFDRQECSSMLFLWCSFNYGKKCFTLHLDTIKYILDSTSTYTLNNLSNCQLFCQYCQIFSS